MTDLERTEMEIVALRHRIETVENTLNALIPERNEAVAILSHAGIQSSALCPKNAPEAISERIRAALALHRAGWSYSRMSKVMGCTEKTCQRWCEHEKY